LDGAVAIDTLRLEVGRERQRIDLIDPR